MKYGQLMFGAVGLVHPGISMGVSPIIIATVPSHVQLRRRKSNRTTRAAFVIDE